MKNVVLYLARTVMRIIYFFIKLFTRQKDKVTFLSRQSDTTSIDFKLLKELFDKERIFLNSSLIKDPAASLKTGDMISVRGFGRFRYLGTEKETKKHRLLIKATVWR